MRTRALTVCLLGTCLALTSACGGSSDPAPPPPTAPTPQPPPPEPEPFMPGTRFVDTTATTGIDRVFNTGDSPIPKDEQRMAGGLAAADFDNDGDIDVFVVGGVGNVNSLFRNDGNNVFTEMAADVNLDVEQWGSGPVFGDIDGDGDLDLFVGAIAGSRPRLFRNDAGLFVDITDSSGLAITSANTISATFADYDQDGDLDLFLSHWGNEPQSDTETLWKNDGSGGFTSASVESGLSDQLITMSSRGNLTDYSFTGTFSDIDGDGDPDILMTSDFKTSKVFRNNGDATFTDITETRVIIDQNGMGSAVGDFDNDGDMDWFVTSIIEETEEERTIPTTTASNPAEAHFGLGAETTADVKVRWPDGSETNLTSVAVDRLLVIEQQP